MNSQTLWYPALRSRVPAPLYSWLTDTGSLTQRLQQHAHEVFSVSLLSNYWVCPSPDEALLLGQNPKKLAYQRDVHLKDGDLPVVYARTIVPASTYKSLRHRFDSLGNRSLGEMLFKDPSVSRGQLEVACLKPGQDLYESAQLYLAEMPAQLWGRRSCFYIEGKPLLVNEIFLPSRIWS